MSIQIYEKLSKPPAEALKKITGGRINGMTDIKPQWRYRVMTEVFGLCGIGWKYTIDKMWTEPGNDGQIMAMVNVSVYIKQDEKWSDAIPGTGGSMLITKESKGLYSSDEAYKMATTDALSVALKMIGVAAAIYEGLWDGSKYKDTPEPVQSTTWEPDDGLIAWGEKLAMAASMEELKKSYDDAFAQYTDSQTRRYIVAAKDKRKAELSK